MIVSGELNCEQKSLIEENHNLVYYVIHKFNLDVEEFYDICALGLCRAAKLWKEGTGAKFSSYAVRCMKSDIINYFKAHKTDKRGKGVEHCSYEAMIYDNHSPEIIKLETSGEDDEIALNIVYNSFKERRSEQEQFILECLEQGEVQQKIADKLGVAQATVSYKLIQMKKAFKKELGLTR